VSTTSGCDHDGWHCSKVSYPWPYAVTRAVTRPDGGTVPEFIRWSHENDPPFPCLCKCGPCRDWRDLKAQIDGPVILPVS
jgi:hypothetical protein